MSNVPKSERNESRREFDAVYFKMADDLANCAYNHFGVDQDKYEKNKAFVDDKCRELLATGDLILRYIRIANTYPYTLKDYETRRDCMNRAIGLCYALLTNYQITMHRLKVSDSKYTGDIEDILHMINSLKKWRASDNRFKKELK